MNPAQLLTHFDRISDAPDAITRLRRFILDLAVRGKLVEQDPSDEPASELLKEIEAERVRLVKAGKIRKQEPTPQVAIEDQPFELPINWQWVRFGSIADFSAGRTPSRHDFSFWNTGDYPWVSIADMRDCGVVTATKETVSAKAKNQVFRSEPAPVGTVIMSFKLTIGKISRLGTPAFHNEAIISIHPYFQTMDDYLFKVLPQFSLQGNTKDAIKGATLNRDSITNIFLPLPPLGEQHRIVARVDELMAHCDRLEAVQAERESRRDRLVASSLNRLSNGADPEAFRDNVRFYFNHIPRLTTKPEHIQRLRQTILNLAVRGGLSLTSNWPEQPQSLNQFATLQNGYAFKSEWFVSNGVRLLRNVNVSHGAIRWDDIACLPQKDSTEFERFQLNNGDIVLSLDRPFIATGTKVARVRPEDLPCLLLQRVGRFQPKLDQLCQDYLFLWLHSPHFNSQIDPGRSNGVPHISSKQVESAEIFVPSLNEQQRIVAKVDELMALCDKLDTQLTTTHTESRRLLEAVLHEALTA